MWRRLAKGSKKSTSDCLSESDKRNDYKLRVKELKDSKEQTPELPNRDYLEDIDFVSKEFDLFFKRQPDLPARMDENLNGDSKNETEKNVSCSKEQPAVTKKQTEEASHYMSLKDAQDCGQSSVSVYESLNSQKKQSILNETAKFKAEESNAASHYQPLTFAENKDYTSSHYQSLNVIQT